MTWEVVYSGCIVEIDEIDENNGDSGDNEKGVTVDFTYNYA